MTANQSAPSEPEKDRRNNWAVAALSAFAALVVGAVASGSSFLTSEVQASSAQHQARDEFVRTQRQTVYTKLVTDSSNGVRVMGDLSKARLTHKDVDTFDAKADATQDLLNADLASIKVIGSNTAIKAGTYVVSVLQTYRWDADMPDLVGQPRLETDFHQCNSAIDRFADAVRAELT